MKKSVAKQKYIDPTQLVRRDVGYEANNNEVFVPDMIDYEKVVTASLKRLQNNNYDSWSMLVKLCFDNPYKSYQKREKSNQFSQADVNPIELMRFHPILNKLSIRTVKIFLKDAKLCKLNPNTLLYGHNESNRNLYFILFGTIVLHDEAIGALGVLTMENTVGEEFLLSGIQSKIDAAYAQKESYLLEISPEKWREMKDILMASSQRAEYLKLDRLIKLNYAQKHQWRTRQIKSNALRDIERPYAEEMLPYS